MRRLGVAKHSVSLHLQPHSLTFPWKCKGSQGSGLAAQSSVSTSWLLLLTFTRALTNDVVIETYKSHLGALPVGTMHRTEHFTCLSLGLYKLLTFLPDSRIKQAQIFLPNSCSGSTPCSEQLSIKNPSFWGASVLSLGDSSNTPTNFAASKQRFLRVSFSTYINWDSSIYCNRAASLYISRELSLQTCDAYFPLEMCMQLVSIFLCT